MTNNQLSQGNLFSCLDVFIPSPDGLLVNLKENKEVFLLSFIFLNSSSKRFSFEMFSCLKQNGVNHLKSSVNLLTLLYQSHGGLKFIFIKNQSNVSN